MKAKAMIFPSLLFRFLSPSKNYPMGENYITKKKGEGEGVLMPKIQFCHVSQHLTESNKPLFALKANLLFVKSKGSVSLG